MSRSLVITSKSFIFGYLKSLNIDELIMVHPKKLSKSNLIEKYDIVIVDFSLDLMISMQNIITIKSNSNKLICLTPSNDPLIFREFPFYLFDFNMSFPFSIKDLLSKINNDEDQFSKTRTILDKFKSQLFGEVVNSIDLYPKNEEELICYYQSLIECGKAAKAEEIKTRYYEANKLPHHPRLKILSSLAESGDFNELIKHIKTEVSYFCQKIEEQIFIQYLNVPISNEYSGHIKELGVFFDSEMYSIKENLRYIPKESLDLFDFCIDDFLSFVQERKFDSYHLASNQTKMAIIIYCLKSLDVNALKFFKKKYLTFSPIINVIIFSLIKNKISQCKKLERHVCDFDYLPCHVEFLKGYQAICFKSSKSKVLHSVYILGKHNKSIYYDGVKKLSNYFKDTKILLVYNSASNK